MKNMKRNFLAIATVLSVLSLAWISGCGKGNGGSSGPAADATPDPFTFTDRTGVDVETSVMSNEITVTGIDAAASISVSTGPGEYSVNGGGFSAEEGSVNNGDTIRLRLMSSPERNTATAMTLTIGGVSGTFNVVTGPAGFVPDLVPDPFVFMDKADVPCRMEVMSNSVTVSGINAEAEVFISGGTGTYSINGGPFTGIKGYVKNGDSVRVRITSSALYSEAVSSGLTIGGVSDAFSATTVKGIVPDRVPDAFSFTDKTGVEKNRLVESDAVVVAGIDSPAVITVEGSEGMYSVNGGAYTSVQGTVKKNDQVTVRLKSASSFGTPSSTYVTIGGVAAYFTAVTETPSSQDDSTPNGFSFAAKTDAVPGSVAVSNEIMVSGIAIPASISISGGGGEYSVNGGAFTASEGTVAYGDKVAVRLTASAKYNTNVFTVLTVGGMTAAFNVTTVMGGWSVVVTGNNHSAGIKDGCLYTWGKNAEGQLGDGSRENRYTPVRIGNDATWKTVAVGDLFTVAIKKDGSLYSWGNNSSGELGINSRDQKAVPTQVGADKNWKTVDAGSGHVLAIKNDGTLYAWGYNAYGQVGNGNRTDVLAPLRIGKDNNWHSVSAGGSRYSMAIKNDGSLYGWGDDSLGQLGDGIRSDITVPKQIGDDKDWGKVSAGGSHTMALKIDGTLYGWGDNRYGEIGDHTKTSKDYPVRIGADDDWADVDAGARHTAAVKTDGTLYAWGDNQAGALGDGTTEERLEPARTGADSDWWMVSCGNGTTSGIKQNGELYSWGDNVSSITGIVRGDRELSPRRVGTANDWDSVAAGDLHVLGLKNDGSVYAWGDNDEGQLGDGTGRDKQVPVRTGVENGWVSVAAGNKSSFAMKMDGSLYVWGSNFYGDSMAGNSTGTNDPILAPARYGTENNWFSAAGGYGIALVLRTDGYVYCLSYNGADAAGSDNDWLTVDVGELHAAGIKDDGSLFTWGPNDYGQLGKPGGNAETNPSRLGLDNDWALVSTGGYHTAALKSDGTLYAWGKNSNGQLGDGTTENRSEPVKIGDDTDWFKVSCGSGHTLAVKADGSLYAWGANESGQIGDGTMVDRNVPVRIGFDSDWVFVSAGTSFSMAIKSDGSLYSWGDNKNGTLGNGKAWFTSPVMVP